MSKRMIVSLVLLIALTVGLAGCGIPYQEVRSNLADKSVLPQAKLKVTTENGYVNIFPALGADIVIESELIVRGDNQLVMEAYMSDMDVTVTTFGDQVEVGIDRDPYPLGVASASVNLTIWVPVAAVNDITLVSSNGPITVQDVNGELKARTNNAAIDLNNVTGFMDLYTRNGKIVAKKIAGQIIADTRNGAIHIQTERKLDDVELITENASIYYQGSVELWEDYVMTTLNGSIEMYLPSGSQFYLQASTTNGQIECEFPIDPEPTDLTEIEGSVNGGGALVDLLTENGNIIIGEQLF